MYTHVMPWVACSVETYGLTFCGIPVSFVNRGGKGIPISIHLFFDMYVIVRKVGTHFTFSGWVDFPPGHHLIDVIIYDGGAVF